MNERELIQLINDATVQLQLESMRGTYSGDEMDQFRTTIRELENCRRLIREKATLRASVS